MPGNRDVARCVQWALIHQPSVKRCSLYAGVKQVYHEVSCACGAVVTCASSMPLGSGSNGCTDGWHNNNAGSSGAGVLNAKEAALVRILGSLWFNQVRMSCKGCLSAIY